MPNRKNDSSMQRMWGMAAAAVIVLAAVVSVVRAQSPRGVDAFSAGRAAYTAGKYDSAAVAFERAIAADSTVAVYHLWLGRALGRGIESANVLRRPFIARRLKAAFDRVVALEPNNIAGHEELIEYYRGAPPLMGGGIDKAWHEADVIAAINPMRGTITRAALALRIGDSVRARREYVRLAEKFPDSLVAVTTAAAFLADSPQSPVAFRALDQWLRSHPGDVVALYAVGRAAAVSGQQLDRGEASLRTVLAAPGVGVDSTLPRPAAIHYRLGDIARRRGDIVGARRAYEQAIALDPKLTAAKRALESLR
jgi:tetratricopeptide (TPR) repeat protein